MNVKRWLSGSAALLLAVSLTPAVSAENPAEVMEPSSDRTQEVLYGEPVDRVYAPSIRSWGAVDGKRLVLYVTAFRPYLVTLNRKVNRVNWDDKIGFDRRSSFLDSRFDRIYIDGFPYAITRIEKLSRETAKALLRKGSDGPTSEAKDEQPQEEQGEQGELDEDG